MECTVQRADSLLSPDNSTASPPKEKPAVILVVDDSSFLRKRLRQALQPDGYTLVEAESGQAALDALAKQEFACVLTDLVMPEVDGFALLTQVQGRHLTVPVVVLTADIQKSTQERCEALGARAILHKPLNAETLRSVVAGVIGGKH
jgi:twitching motility two-component system response regulator PilH